MKKCLAVSLLSYVLFDAFCGSSKKNIKEFSNEEISKMEHSANEQLTDRSTYKVSLEIPESIKKSVPKEMWNSVFFQLVVNLLKTEYVYEMSEEEITEKALKGLLSTLDTHSSYMDEKTFTSLRNQTDGEFGGLGIEIMMDDGFVRIKSPIDDTPAYKAGLKSGDMIIYVNDECINGLSSDEVLSKLRGKPKTKVKLKIKRADKNPFNVEIERDLIKIQSVKAELIDNIGYIRISAFDKNTSKDLKKFINENKGKALNGIVLDLRNNPGGLLDEAVAVSNIFLNEGQKIVSIRGRTPESTKYYSSKDKDLLNGLPIVVLINNGSASASEIVAGALRDNKRAITVGIRSFGKGSVQKVIPLSEKSAIKLTVAKYYTPNGESIQANGITPDIEADYAEIKHPDAMFVVREEFFPNALDADKRAKNKKMSDIENKKAIEKLDKKKNDKKTDDEEIDAEVSYRKMPLKERIQKDYQLNKAVDVLNIIAKCSEKINQTKINDKSNEKGNE